MEKLYIIMILVLLVLWDFVRWNRKQVPLSKKKIAKLQTVLKKGDFVATWGSGFLGYLVSRLISLGHGVKTPSTHIMHVHTDGVNGTFGSAEPKGYRLVSFLLKLTKCTRMMVFRFPNINHVHIHRLQYLTNKYTKKKYDYFYYLIRFFQAMTVFIPAFFLFAHGLKTALILVLVMIIIYIPGMQVLRRREKDNVHCSEAESELARQTKLLKFFPDRATTNTPPHEVINLLLNAAELVHDTDKK